MKTVIVLPLRSGSAYIKRVVPAAMRELYRVFQYSHFEFAKVAHAGRRAKRQRGIGGDLIICASM